MLVNEPCLGSHVPFFLMEVMSYIRYSLRPAAFVFKFLLCSCSPMQCGQNHPLLQLESLFPRSFKEQTCVF